MLKMLATGGLLAALLAQAAPAAEVTFDCSALDRLEPLSFRFAGDTLEMRDSAGTAALPASLEGDLSEMFGVSAFGEAEQMVPPPAALDACLSKYMADHGLAVSDESVAGGLASCQVDLAAQAVRQPVDLRVTAAVIDPGTAMIFLQRTYHQPSSVTGAPLTLDEFPTRDCPAVVE